MTPEKAIKRYSQAFKQQIVQEYEAGQSLADLQKKYGISGSSTIQGWIGRYGREGVRHKLLVIQSPTEQHVVKEYQERLKQLEKAVAQLTLDKLMLAASLAEAEARLGEEVKKKGRSQIIERAYRASREPGSGINMGQICAWLGVSWQAHYQLTGRQAQRAAQEELILARVRALRQRHPRLGARKIRHELAPGLAEKGLLPGRDRFFDLLARPRAKRRPTFSGSWRCPNLLTDLTVAAVQQGWVGDITYLETARGFCYLSLVTDAFSRFIVGFDVSTSLAVEGALRALNMAMTQATRPLAGLIHPSDHGIQYTCQLYRDRLAQAHILTSMGEVGNCYDNALAERVNGILKLEYGLDNLFVDVAQAVTGTQQAVWLYNHERPHLSLNYRKPVEIHLNLLPNQQD